MNNNRPDPGRQDITLRLFQWSARLALGGMFLYLGAVKAADPVGFLKLARQFHLIETPIALNFVAAVLPWFEIFCGVLIITGLALRGTALLLALMLAVFTVAVAVRAIGIYQTGGIPFCSVRFDCGCGTGEVLICWKLLENLALWSLSVILLRAAIPTKLANQG